jgi:DNA-binding XRE family transcriptional regulator
MYKRYYINEISGTKSRWEEISVTSSTIINYEKWFGKPLPKIEVAFL